ncbi:SOS response-associated peptidase [Ruminococcaceae bacterium OttesenSCG-928-A16]|nr:SOS response-associated peptidase [Ruminococcaceae bacterium OttesenSCG-928-A16]
MCTRFTSGGTQTTVNPTDNTTVYMLKNGKLGKVTAAFGFAGPGGLVLNARSETLLQKPMFAPWFGTGRAVVVAQNFFEWGKDAAKTQYAFYNANNHQQPLLLAALVRYWPNGPRFVVLTTAANQSMQAIHHRMPLLLSKQEANAWLHDEKQAEELLHKVPPPLYSKVVEKPGPQQISLL